ADRAPGAAGRLAVVDLPALQRQRPGARELERDGARRHARRRPRARRLGRRERGADQDDGVARGRRAAWPESNAAGELRRPQRRLAVLDRAAVPGHRPAAARVERRAVGVAVSAPRRSTDRACERTRAEHVGEKWCQTTRVPTFWVEFSLSY